MTSLLDSDSNSNSSSDTDIPDYDNQLDVPIRNINMMKNNKNKAQNNKNKWTVELQTNTEYERASTNISDVIERRKRQTGSNKVRLTESELDILLK